MSPWITVEERLPESGQAVLFCWRDRAEHKNRVGSGFYAGKHSIEAPEEEAEMADRSWSCEYSDEDDEFYRTEGFYERPVDIPYTALIRSVTHWMPAPTHPQEMADDPTGNTET